MFPCLSEIPDSIYCYLLIVLLALTSSFYPRTARVTKVQSSLSVASARAGVITIQSKVSLNQNFLGYIN